MPIKRLIVYLFISISLEAESFDTLLSKALSRNYSLKSDSINIKKEIIRGDISTRWNNPKLELELSRFDERLDDMGFRTSITQSIPLPSIQRDREILSAKNVELKRAIYRLNYEEDRGEGVVRLGVSIPLGINDRKDEERQLAKLESKQNLLKLDREKIRLEITLNELRDEATSLYRLKEKNQKILSDEKILLEKFQEAYRIAAINLLELQEVKNRLIQTKNRLIKIEIAKSQNAIEQNYILGVYNG